MPEAEMSVAIIGCGTMGSVFAKALGCKYRLYLFDRNPEKSEKLAEMTGAVALSSFDQLKEAGIVILAVKPKDFQTASAAILPYLSSQAMIVSILSKITLHHLRQQFGSRPIARMMSNMAAAYGKSATALCGEGSLSDFHKEMLAALASQLGKYWWISEDLMPGFIALAGSSPAFFSVIIESMVDAGIALGFKPEQGLSIALQALIGTGEMLIQTGQHPAVLKWQVATPSGTTIAGLMAQEQHQLRHAMIQTVLKTAQKE